MQLEYLELLVLDLALRRPLRSGARTHLDRQVLYLHVVTNEAEGWGECGALPGGTNVDPSLDQVEKWLQAEMIPRLLANVKEDGGRCPSSLDVTRYVDQSRASPMAVATLEMAILDAELKSEGTSLAAWLGVRAKEVPIGAMVGIPEDRSIDAILANVSAYVDRGYARIRLKIEPGFDKEPVRALRSCFPSLTLHVDANGMYCLGGGGPDDAFSLLDLDQYGLVCVEQPLDPKELENNFATLRELASAMETPICLDESLASIEDLSRAIETGVCDVACIKPARLGGIEIARLAGRICANAGIDAFVGGFYDTGLARSAHGALAGADGFTMVSDLSEPETYLKKGQDPAPIAWVGEKVARIWQGPGIGPGPNLDRLEQRLSATWRIDCNEVTTMHRSL